jgi:hypothetical protein
MAKMWYAERLGDTDTDEDYIAERGVFMSVEEFVPYRLKGWSGTKELDDAADAIIRSMPCGFHAGSEVPDQSASA